jgi:hypothetical protein
MDSNTVPIKLICLVRGDSILLQAILVDSDDIYNLKDVILEEGQKHSIFRNIVAEGEHILEVSTNATAHAFWVAQQFNIQCLPECLK